MTELTLKKMRKSYKKPQKNWSVKEIEFLKDNYLTMKPREIARELGRTSGGVATYAIKVLGLPKKREVENE